MPVHKYRLKKVTEGSQPGRGKSSQVGQDWTGPQMLGEDEGQDTLGTDGSFFHTIIPATDLC